jgi:hypothetical protein
MVLAMIREGDTVMFHGDKVTVFRGPRADGVMLVRHSSGDIERTTLQEVTTGRPPRGWIPRREVWAKRPGYETWRIRIRVVPRVSWVPASSRWVRKQAVKE